MRAFSSFRSALSRSYWCCVSFSSSFSSSSSLFLRFFFLSFALFFFLSLAIFFFSCFAISFFFCFAIGFLSSFAIGSFFICLLFCPIMCFNLTSFFFFTCGGEAVSAASSKWTCLAKGVQVQKDPFNGGGKTGCLMTAFLQGIFTRMQPTAKRIKRKYNSEKLKKGLLEGAGGVNKGTAKNTRRNAKICTIFAKHKTRPTYQISLGKSRGKWAVIQG